MKQHKNYKIGYLLLFILMSATLKGLAQYPAALPGKEGIFVYFSKTLPAGFNYKLERKAYDEKNIWQDVYTSSTPSLDYIDVYNKLLSFNAKMPFYSVPDSVTLQKFISLVRGKKTIDSIWVFNAYPPYLELLGTGYFDNSTRPGVKYEYRVSKTDSKGKVLESSLTKVVSFPGERKDFRAVSYESTAWGEKINIRYNISGSTRPTGFRVYRQNYLQTPFREHRPMTSFITGKSGYTMLLTDTLISPGMIYRYVVIPYDLYGNDGQISDTVMINNVPVFGMVPAIRDLEAISLDDRLAIKLRWKSTPAINLRSISIFRSTNFDDGYTLYSKALPADTVFIDTNVEPITNYYYYLVFNGAYGDSPETAKVIGMVKGLRKPLLPPMGVKIKSSPEGNKISWNHTGHDTKGYVVFRGEGYSDPTEQISDLLPVSEDTISFTDSASILRAGQPYCYAVKSVNTSNLLSTMSETVIASIITPSLPTPLNLEVRNYNGSALLIWEDMKSISDNITGYNVWRQTFGSSDKELISKDIEVEANTFLDSTVQRGIKYLYFVQATGIINSESSISSPFEFTLKQLLPVPPAGLRATKTNEGIILNWDTPAFEGLKGFNIYREKLGEKKSLLESTESGTTGYNDNISEKGTYFYTITSISDKNGESVPCDEVGITIE